MMSKSGTITVEAHKHSTVHKKWDSMCVCMKRFFHAAKKKMQQNKSMIFQLHLA